MSFKLGILGDAPAPRRSAKPKKALAPAPPRVEPEPVVDEELEFAGPALSPDYEPPGHWHAANVELAEFQARLESLSAAERQALQELRAFMEQRRPIDGAPFEYVSVPSSLLGKLFKLALY